ncbi:C6 zinc finger domain protein [Colletotrichum karsti]|uniref:C6 zinc finger domain protein n=1 Tax=Colletotrichum karsti TaxID=1095194 RepID=A0A9P6IFA2_9PEZI|nr:C6 zinc finger domain protein [Colletotrichum karsti]KAF9880841.1 C6 zinc finger domain protein [Colletotrichum karsti]
MMRLVRLGDDYRIGPLRHHTPPPDLLEKQRSLQQSLDQWYTSWRNLDERSNLPSTRIKGGPRINVLLKYELSYIWTDMAFTADEISHDRHLERFRQIIEQASKFAESQLGNNPSHFLFEAGFTPSLFFIATKCRALDVRLEALRLLTVLGSPREAMWDKGELFCIARRLIELEHNVGLDVYGQLQFTGPDSCLGLPLDEVRVRHFVPENRRPWQFATHGDESSGSFKVGYFLRTAEDTLYVHQEVLGCEYYSDLSTLDGAHESYSSSPGSIEGELEIAPGNEKSDYTSYA